MAAGEEDARSTRAAESAGDVETYVHVLRHLLITFIALTAAIALIALAYGHLQRALLSATGGGMYILLLAGLRRFEPRRIGYLTVIWYLTLAAGAMASGRGIYDVSVVLLPAGIVMGALLLEPSHVKPLIAVCAGIVAAVGSAHLIWPATRSDVGAPSALDVLIVSLLLLVSGAVTQLVVRSLQRMLARRREADAEVRRAKLEIEARNDSLQLVNQLADRLHRTLDVDAIATEAVAALAGHGGASLAALYLLNDRGSELRLVAECGFIEEERRLAETLPVEGSLTGAAVRERRILVAEDMRGDSGVRLEIASLPVSRGLVTAIAVPLLYGSEALGSINLAFRERRSFGPLDLETFQAIGRTVSLAITNARHVAGLEYQAFHDSLTALPNRWSLHRRLAALLEAQEGRIALMLVDLRRFREINEALGHNVGDELLQSVATRLALGREGERSEVFRLGGDEFAVLLQEVDDEGNAEARAQRLHDAMREPCSVGGISVELHTSVGVAVQSDGGDGRELLRRADVAVYRSKQTGVGVVPYGPELDRHTPERLALLADLARAIREGGLELHYQPKVSLRDGAIVGFEALVRWPHPKLGLLFPADFLPLAESTEVINPLTYWVVESALGQLRKWNEVYPELTMAINLSVRNLLDRNCSQRLEELMRSAGVDPARVEFELTETAVMTDPEAALTMLQRITSTGAHLAIDDFGTGFSSLVYLKRFPLHGIKIDRSFVIDMAKGEQSLAIVRSTVQLARSLGLSVVAEGIEDFQTASELREIGCDQAQGYFFASPAASSEIDSLLSTDERFPQYGHHRGSP